MELTVRLRLRRDTEVCTINCHQEMEGETVGKRSSERWSLALLTGPGLILFFWLVRRGPWLTPDSPSYLHDASIVSPLYPAVLRLYALLFGADSYFFLVVLQLLGGLSVCALVARRLRRVWGLPPSTDAVFALILALPYLMATRFGNGIMSEALAYPLYLLLIGDLLAGLLQVRFALLVRVLLWTMLLMLTRRQFFFLYPVLALALGYVLARPGWRKRGTWLLVLFLGSIVATQVLEYGAQYARDKHFASIPFTGFQLVTSALFVSQPEDGALMPDSLQRRVFQRCHELLDEQGLLLEASRAAPQALELSETELFRAAYLGIGWHTLKPVMTELGVTDWYRRDEMALSMYRILVRAHPKSYLHLYRLRFVEAVGGALQLVFLIVLATLAATAQIKGRDGLSSSLFLLVILHLGNLALITLAEPVLARYAAYTSSLLLCGLLALAWRLLRIPSAEHSYPYH